MAYLADRSVNLLNAHYGLRHAAIAGGAAFFLPHLLKAGFTVPQVLVAVAAILAGRFILRPVLVPLARRTGLRALVIAGTLVCALQYPLIAGIDGIGWRFAAFLAVSSVGDMIYWTAIHAYFSALGNDVARGRQLGARESIAALVGTIGPVLMGYLLTSAGPGIAFGVSAVITVASIGPLLFAPDATIKADAGPADAAPRDSLMLFHADGWIGATAAIAWATILFASLGQSFTAYGGALALAAIVGASSALLFGHAIDQRQGARVVAVALGVLAVSVALKAYAHGDATLVMVANAAGALAFCLYVPALMTSIYTAAKASPCVLRFHVATEGAWDLGAIAALLATAALISAGAPLWSGVLLAFIGIAIATPPMLRSYARHAAAAPLR